MLKLEVNSDWGLVREEIPQDSALGPLIFLIYMNMMSFHIHHGKLFQYAGDTVLYVLILIVKMFISSYLRICSCYLVELSQVKCT